MNSDELLRLSDLAESPRVGLLKWWFYRTFLGRDLDGERAARQLERIFDYGDRQRKQIMDEFNDRLRENVLADTSYPHINNLGMFYDVT